MNIVQKTEKLPGLAAIDPVFLNNWGVSNYQEISSLIPPRHTEMAGLVLLTFFFWLWTAIPSSLSPSFIHVPSLEERMGIPRKDIRDGEERFILMECPLKRTGFESIGFTVPTRSTISPFQDVRVVQFL